MSNKRLSINMGSNMFAFLVNIGINFLLTPYIIVTVGSEAFGFVGLGNNFIIYASILTIALNSMAGRFISIKVHQENYNDANKYFTSVFIANLFISFLILAISLVFISSIEKILSIPPHISLDVKYLFIFLALNFILSTLGSVFSVATFIKNRLDLSSLRNIESNAIKVIALYFLFYFFNPSISFLGMAYLLATIFVVIINIYYTRKLVPFLKLNKSHFDLKAIFEIISSGIWNTIVKLGQLLLNGLDLLMANIYISTVAMGTLAIAKTMPLFVSSLVGMIAAVFMPTLTIQFAKNNMNGLIADTKQAMKIMGIIIGIPVAIFIAYGDVFYSLWTPSEDAKELHILSILSIATIIVSGSINILYNLFTVVNKLKVNALWLVTTGLLNVIIVYILLNHSQLELYAIVGVSTVISILRNLLITAPYGAKCLGIKWYSFYSEILKGCISVIVVVACALGIRMFINMDSWVELIIISGIAAILGLIINAFIILNKKDRNKLKFIVKKKLSRLR